MDYFKWETEYETNVKIIDEQHKNLLDMINKLHNMQVMNLSKDKNLLLELLNEIGNYINYHFNTEEYFMQENKYNLYDIHKTYHDEFSVSIQDIKKKINNGNKDIDRELLDFLKDWLIKHILVIDKKLGLFLNEKSS